MIDLPRNLFVLRGSSISQNVQPFYLQKNDIVTTKWPKSGHRENDNNDNVEEKREWPLPQAPQTVPVV